MGVTPGRECVAPVHDYATTRGGDACVIGGLIPSGCGWEDPWTSRYFFGDNSSGKIWTLNVNANRDGIMGGATQIGTSQGVGSFRMGAKGALYIAEVSGGVVSKLTPKDLDPTMCQGSGGAGGAGGSGGTGSGATSGGPGTGGDSAGSSQGGSPSAGSGGSGGSAAGGGGMSNGGSGPQAGTSSATGGTGTGTGGSATAGTGVGGSGTPSGGKGGSAPTGGGVPGTSGTSGTPEPNEGSDDGGCGCRVAGSGGRFGAVLAAAAGLALLAFRRSRKQQRESRR
jgi:MYXO-CTERM domain-containing protein